MTLGGALAILRAAEADGSAGGSDPFAHVGPTLDALRDSPTGSRILHLRAVAPAVAFSRRDELRPGFAAAAAAATRHGFAPVVRPVGGTAAALGTGSLVVDLYGSTRLSDVDHRARFVVVADALLGVLRDLGIAAEIGPLPDEYCPGEFSIHARGKLVGIAQRSSRGVWLVSAIVQVTGADALRAVIGETYELLELPVDLATVGAVDDEVSGARVDDVAARIAQAFVTRDVVPADGVVTPR
jgi:octanoyl-[GcvH]:protein N-octanoyltransferase